jgi:hypothetical protein
LNFLDHFKEIWLVDTEFYPEGGEGGLPVPVCLVAKEFRTGQELRYWSDELKQMSKCPYETGSDSITVAYYASAEMGTFLSLGWELPKWILDLFCEFRCETNGYYYPNGAGLLGALSWYGKPVASAAEKDAYRQIILKGAGNYTSEERKKILNYCASDVEHLERLLKAMSGGISELARIRGRYMKAVARMERNGVPIDISLLKAIVDRWEDLKFYLVKEVDKDFLVYDGLVFKRDWFLEHLKVNFIQWPMLESGVPSLTDETFKDMCRIHPRLEPLRQLRFILSKLRKLDLSVGPDDRNRVSLSAFRAKTSRNQPSATKFVFGPATWIRSLIKPREGTALAYVDWSSAEFGIAASLSGDQAMKSAYLTGDPYLTFAKMSGAVPSEATKTSHKRVRDIFKTACLGTQYGIGSKSLAVKLNISFPEAIDLLNKHKRIFKGFWRWVDYVKDSATFNKKLVSMFGWTYHLADSKPNLRSVINFPMQATCAEMLRLACSWATENGVKVCCPVHDALLIESEEKDILDVVRTTQYIMEKASQKVLGEETFKIRTDTKIVRYPNRYMDDRGLEMWTQVLNFLNKPCSEEVQILPNLIGRQASSVQTVTGG